MLILSPLLAYCVPGLPLLENPIQMFHDRMRYTLHVTYLKQKPLILLERYELQLFVFQFNFVGKLLGPKGNSLKRMQEETLTKMAVLGKGSMRDKAKEEEMRLSKVERISSYCQRSDIRIIPTY